MKIKNIRVDNVSVPTAREVIMRYSVVAGITEPRVPPPPNVSALIRVETDTGVTGIGSTFGKATLIEQLKPFFINEDPFEIARMVQRSLQNFQLMRYRDVLLRNLTGIEIACWDIMGKVLNVPVHKLIGGLYREKVPLTAFLGIKSPKEAAKDAVAAVEQGFKTIKQKVGRDDAEDVEIVKSVRDAIGYGVELRIDPNSAYTVDKAVRQIKKMARFDPQYVEQPIAEWDIDGLAHLRRVTGVPIAMCESMVTIERAMQAARKEAVDFLSTDLTRMGGIRQFQKLCGIAEAAGLNVALHIALTSVLTAAWIQTQAATPILSYATDSVVSESGLVDDVLKEPFKPENGYLKVPSKPGLGIDIDDAKVEKYRLA